ncbi:MAG: OmpA family protein [Bacteroidales bacterium]|jgi:outer membrane protein OmpA-like peptidoglycan-associated protein|nr:OmpA family protein [Bacteroidales bacterium]
MRKIVLFIVFSLFAIDFYAQENPDAKEIFMDAEYYIMYEDYKEALPLYQKLTTLGKNDAYINYRIGECYLHIPGIKEKAIPYLEKARENISPKFKEGSIKETAAPEQTLFYLGKAYQVDNKLDKAIEYYQEFKELLAVDDIFNIDYVDQQIQTCMNAKELMRNPVRIKKTNLGEPVNNEFPNTRPVVSSNEDVLLYTTKLRFYDAIYFSEKNNGEWQDPENLTPVIRSDGEYYPSSLSNDGETLLLFKYEGYSGDLYLSRYENGTWQVPTKLNKNINSRSWETNACLSPDGKIIYFVSDRKEGFGGLDLYQSTWNEETQSWGEAVNLGPEINTPFNEEMPALSEDGKTLYFSSQGHYNMGGFDIFYATQTDDNQWSTPVNIGYPINSTDDDLFFYPVKEGHFAYISCFDENGYGQEDIIRIEIFSPDHPYQVNVKGKVTLQDNQTDFHAEDFSILIKDASKTKILDSLRLDEETGEFSVDLTPGNYHFFFLSKEYQQKVKPVSIPENYTRSELMLGSVELVPLAVTTGEYLTIKSIFFDFDSHHLTKEARIELERLHNLMIQYPSLYIEVIGHTDAVGSASYNLKLSIKRSREVIDYLTQRGIAPKRFVAKGAGKNEPVAINTNDDGSDNPEGRRYNRRVEIKILKSDEKLIIKDDINIPEHLKHKDLSYHILITKQQEELPEDYFESYDALKEYTIKTYNNAEYFYILGDTKEKSELIKIFNTVLELGFNEAEIISSYDLQDILHQNRNRPEELNLRSKTTLYGIQLRALKKPTDPETFKPLEVKEIKCLDGYYRYIYGEYTSFKKAKEQLNEIIAKGYTDAFIVNLNQLP